METFKFDGDAYGVLQDIARREKISEVDVLQNALGLYDYYVAARRQGARLLVECNGRATELCQK